MNHMDGVQMEFFFKGEKKPSKKGLLNRTILSNSIGPLSCHNGFDYPLIQPVRLSALCISFNGGAFEGSRCKKVDNHPPPLICDGRYLLFSLCSVAENPSPEGMDRVIKRDCRGNS